MKVRNTSFLHHRPRMETRCCTTAVHQLSTLSRQRWIQFNPYKSRPSPEALERNIDKEMSESPSQSPKYPVLVSAQLALSY